MSTTKQTTENTMVFIGRKPCCKNYTFACVDDGSDHARDDVKEARKSGLRITRVALGKMPKLERCKCGGEV